MLPTVLPLDSCVSVFRFRCYPWVFIRPFSKTTLGLLPQTVKVPAANAGFGTIPDHEKINYSVAQDGPKTYFSIIHYPLQSPLSIAFGDWRVSRFGDRGIISFSFAQV